MSGDVSGEAGVLRLNARPTEETERALLKVEVETAEDLIKLAERLKAPIVKDGQGNDAVIDVRDAIMYFVRRGRPHAH